MIKSQSKNCLKVYKIRKDSLHYSKSCHCFVDLSVDVLVSSVSATYAEINPRSFAFINIILSDLWTKIKLEIT